MAEIDFVEHYKQDNGRIAGWQLERGNLDARQRGILFVISQVKPETVLDLGCSDGTLLISLYKEKLIKKGYGVDLWTAGINWGNDYCNQNKLPIVLMHGPIEDYDGPDVDLIILAEILEHVKDPVQCLTLAATKAPQILITVPLIYTGPINKIPEFQEHIRQYDGQMILEHCEKANLKIKYKSTIGTDISNWPNLLILAESEGQNGMGSKTKSEI